MRYTWDSPDSLIKEVEVIPCGKHKEGFIYAPAGAEPEKLHDVAAKLREAGFAVIPDVKNERHVLRVEQLLRSGPLLDVLTAAGATAGSLHSETMAQDHEKPKSFSEKFKENTVPIAGASYVVGDAFMILAGLVRNKGLTGEALKGGHGDTMTGLLWALPNVGLMLFGKKNPEMQSALLLRRVKDYLDNQGVEIPREEELTLDHLVRKDGALARIVDFLYEHPTEINNSFEAVGGLVMAHGGQHQKIGLKEEKNWYKTTAGALVFTGMGSSVLLSEKKKPLYEIAGDGTQNIASDPQVAGQKQDAAAPAPDNRNALQRGFDWLTEKPLRLAGSLPILNNLLNTWGAWKWEKPKVAEFLGEYDAEKLKRETTLHHAEDIKDILKAGKELEELEIKKTTAKNYGEAANFNLASVAAFLFANFMYTHGSKDTGVDIKALGGLDEVYAVVAKIISAQPKEHQPELIQNMAGFLSSQQDVKETSRQIALKLTAKVRAQEQSPWTERVAIPPHGAEVASQPSL